MHSGHRVTVLGGAPHSSQLVREGVHVVRVRAPYANEMGWLRRVGAFLTFMLKATWVALRRPSDAIFASSTPLTVAVPALIASMLKRQPFIFEVRDLWPSVPIALGYLSNPVLRRAAGALERLTYRRAAHVVALSPGMADGVRSVSPDTPVTVIPNASDVDLFRTSLSRRSEVREEMGWDDKTVLVYAGSFGRTYDLEWIVDLAAELKGRDVIISIYGLGAATQTLTERALRHGLDPKTLLPGPLPRSEIARVLPASDAVFSTLIPNPALEANSLNKVFDAMAAGRPLIFNHGGWLEELAISEGAGWRLPRETSAAASQLTAILDDPTALPKAGEVSARLGETHFDRERLFAQFETVLRNAHRSRHAPGRPTDAA